jgi:hypothetical protein
LASAIKCPEISDPKWEGHLRNTPLDTKDFNAFLKFRSDKGSPEFEQLTSTLRIDAD